MLVAVLLPVLIGLFLLAMHRFEARVFGPPDEDAGGPVRHGSVEPTARGHIRRGRTRRRSITPERRTPSPRVGNLRPLRSGVTALQRAAACWGAKVHGDRHNGNGADIDRQGSGRPIEGHGPWTHR
jgi:hypothetical protein